LEAVREFCDEDLAVIERRGSDTHTRMFERVFD
jgi:hypothetical protein